MDDIDPIEITHVHKFFPELTEKEMLVCFLFCREMNRYEIAEHKRVSVTQIDNLLRTIRKKLKLTENQEIKVTYLLRVLRNSRLS
ncbi:hypothetical protein GE278_24145 (plasmid) [Enterobacteriaceae bacterium Kacie_13]|nr:hypothetical protein GE278_24145 [Enterobacteriaceae bacterium Kacie_13]